MEDSICKQLLLNTTTYSGIKCMSDTWWACYDSDHQEAMNILKYTFFTAGGFINIGNEEVMNILLMTELTCEDFRPDSNPKNILIFNKKFSENFRRFIACLFQKDEWRIFRHKDLLDGIIDVIQRFLKSGWNALRGVASVSGLTVFGQTLKCHAHYKDVSTEGISSSTLEKLSVIEKTLYNGIFRHCIRDMEPHIRMVPMKEMTFWLEDFPYNIFIQNFKEYIKYVKRCLADTDCVQTAALELLTKTYETANREDSILTEMFKLIQTDVYACLSNDSDSICSKALEIILHAAMSNNCHLTESDEVPLFYFFNFEKEYRHAKVLVYDIILRGLSGVELLMKIISLLYKCSVECSVQNHKMVIYHLFEYLIQHLTWTHWLQALNMCEKKKKETCTIIFYEFTSLVMGATLDNIPDEIQEKILALKDSFTTEISQKWLRVITADEIKMDIASLMYLIKMISWFDFGSFSEEACSKTQSLQGNSTKRTEVCAYLPVEGLNYLGKQIINIFLEGTDGELLAECMSIIIKLPSEFYELIDYPGVMNDFIEDLCNSSSPSSSLLIKSKRLSLIIKSLDCDADLLWNRLIICVDFCEKSKEPHIAVLLWDIVMVFKKLYTDNAPTLQENLPYSKLDVLKAKVLIVLKHLQQCLQNEIDFPQFDLKACQIFHELINTFRSIFTQSHYKVVENCVEMYKETCAQLMTKTCKNYNKGCCTALKRFGDLIIDCKISDLALSFLFCHYGPQNKPHSEVLMNILEKYSAKTNTAKCGIIFTNGIIMCANEVLSLPTAQQEVPGLKENLFEKFEFVSRSRIFKDANFQLMVCKSIQLIFPKIPLGPDLFTDIYQFLVNTVCTPVRKVVLSAHPPPVSESPPESMKENEKC